MEANCIKVVHIRENKFESVWGKEDIGDFHRTYEINKPTYPENGTLLFCYDLNDSVKKDLLEKYHVCKTDIYLAHATDLKDFKKTINFRHLPSVKDIQKYWDSLDKMERFPYPLYRHWRFASSITLLEPLK